MVGTIEPRKRHAFVLDALERLWADGSPARLLLLGKAGWADPNLVKRLRSHPEIGHRLLWLDDAGDAEVHRAYEEVDALIFASVYEGFGLPIVEAARMGLPVIASDIPVLREVGGDGAAYFRVDDAAALAEAVRAFLDGARPDPSRIRDAELGGKRPRPAGGAVRRSMVPRAAESEISVARGAGARPAA